MPEEAKLSPQFKTFDFFDDATGLVIQRENFGYNHAFPTDQSAADLYDPEGKC